MKKLSLDELGRMSVAEFKDADKLNMVLVLDNLRSLHNVGSAFRTADAFRIQKIVLCGITGTPPHREIHKTALGSTESVDWAYVENTPDAIRQLKDDGYEIILVEQTTESIPLQTWQPLAKRKYAIVFGNEVNGVSDDVIGLGDCAIEIPQAGTKHSLNVSVCLGIVAWHLYRTLKL